MNQESMGPNTGRFMCLLCPVLLGMTPPWSTALADEDVTDDVVLFLNGDRLTGEVKSLERGRLRFKTAATDTISIEWDDIASVRSAQNIQVETQGGVRYLGQLTAAEE